MNLGRALLASWPSAIPVDTRPIGQSYGGGYYAGRIQIGSNVYELVVAPKEVGEATLANQAWNFSFTGNTSLNDGKLTQSNMVAYGISSFPAQQAVISSVNAGGFTDWYIGSKEEMEVIYRALKPSTTVNVTTSGLNSSSIPTTSNYTTTNPPQTSVAIFRTGGAQQFAASPYASVTQGSGGPLYMHTKSFSDGSDASIVNDSYTLVRAIRRILVA